MPEIIGAPWSDSGLARHSLIKAITTATAVTSSRQLGAIAARAKPALLVLYHQLMWTSNEEELLKEVRSVTTARSCPPHDLDVY